MVYQGTETSPTQKKNDAFLQGDSKKEERNNEIGSMIKKSTDRLDKVEKKLRTGIARDAWKGLNKMMGRQQRPAPQCDDPLTLSNNLNSYYFRFVKREFEAVCPGMTPCPNMLQDTGVIPVFHRVNPCKTPGPAGLKRKVLKEQTGAYFDPNIPNIS